MYTAGTVDTIGTVSPGYTVGYILHYLNYWHYFNNFLLDNFKILHLSKINTFNMFEIIISSNQELCILHLVHSHCEHCLALSTLLVRPILLSYWHTALIELFALSALLALSYFPYCLSLQVIKLSLLYIIISRSGANPIKLFTVVNY